MILKNKTSGVEILQKVFEAKSFGKRLMGLMFKEKLPLAEGLMIYSCNSIHTCFMKFPIDVAFLNDDLKVIKIYSNIKPWRLTRLVLGASIALETNGGGLNEKVSVGDQLELVNV